MTRNYEDNKLIEEAIKFLVASIEKSGKNPKPVILHSIKVAVYLEKFGYTRDVVIGALLHDLFEDTDVTRDEVIKKFGENVTRLVEANSFDESIVDTIERYIELFEKCKQAGKDALVIKAADILYNSDYYGSNESLWQKMKYFIEFSESDLKNEHVWLDLKNQYKKSKPD
ncbi:MAG: HD domain-containing protein [Parcubacteria group bacterium]|nr:HD domain-containing protein [Parcubacteria group bacterium]MBI3074599.1 HD domain-containing protein [Parcubacteria group bacterium]